MTATDVPGENPTGDSTPDLADDSIDDTPFREPFGFTWGETDETTWLRTDDGDYKRIHPVFFDRLAELAGESVDPDALDERARRAVTGLYDEGYLQPGDDVTRHETPADIRLWPRIGAFAATIALFVLFLAIRRSEIQRLPTDLEFGFGLAVVVLPFLLGSIAIHELGHYVPSRRHFDPQLRFGFLNTVIPAIITRTTDAWGCPRNVRLWISLAGPFADAVVATALAGAFVVFPNQPLLGFLALLIAARVVFVLNPLVEGDGYWILVDAFGWHNLRSRGFRDLERRIVSGPAVYALSVVCFTVGFVVFNLAVLVTVFGIV